MDLLDFLAELDAPDGRDPGRCPMGYTEDRYTLEEITKAYDAWRDRHGKSRDTHYTGWRLPMWEEVVAGPDGHTCAVVSAARDGRYCDYMHRAIDDACGWASPIVADREAVLLAWHDHAWPGWRDLPALVASNSTNESRWPDLIRAAQPEAWQVPNAPIVTGRPHRATSRTVIGRSPWGGCDISTFRRWHTEVE